MSTIAEHKKSILISNLHSLEGKVNEILHTIELDESVTDEQYRNYEKQFDEIYVLIDQIRDAIIFS